MMVVCGINMSITRLEKIALFVDRDEKVLVILKESVQNVGGINK